MQEKGKKSMQRRSDMSLDCRVDDSWWCWREESRMDGWMEGGKEGDLVLVLMMD